MQFSDKLHTLSKFAFDLWIVKWEANDFKSSILWKFVYFVRDDWKRSFDG